jgi:starch phosphorylase
MSEQTRIGHPKERLLEGLDSLAKLALDLRSSWNHATDHVWRQLAEPVNEMRHSRLAI